MSKVPSPAEIRNGKQPISTDTLIRWAEASGFEIKRSKHGTSHVTYRHKDYPDIGSNFIINSRQTGSQRSFADCLVEIENRKIAEKERNKESFAKATAKRINNAYKNLPSFLTAEHDFQTACTVLRDKQLPQLGVTIPFSEARLLENKVRYLESLKREAFILLNRAKMEYDIEIGVVRGKFGGQLSHAIYDIEPKIIPTYQADETPEKIIEKINDFIWKVVEKDGANDARLDTLLANDFVGAAAIAYHSRRGARTNAVRVERPDGGSFVLKFETASNRRPMDGDVHRGRIAEPELARLERTIGALAYAYHKAEEMTLRAA